MSHNHIPQNTDAYSAKKTAVIDVAMKRFIEAKNVAEKTADDKNDEFEFNYHITDAEADEILWVYYNYAKTLGRVVARKYLEISTFVDDNKDENMLFDYIPENGLSRIDEAMRIIDPAVAWDVAYALKQDIEESRSNEKITDVNKDLIKQKIELAELQSEVQKQRTLDGHTPFREVKKAYDYSPCSVLIGSDYLEQ